MLINQVPGRVPVNVLHDQGIPNTLSGMKPAPIGLVRSRNLAVGPFVLAIAVLAAALAIIIAQAAS